MNVFSGRAVARGLGTTLVVCAALASGCGGGGGGSSSSSDGEIIAALAGTPPTPSPTAVDRTPPDPETRAVLGEVVSATLGLAAASSVMATEAEDQAPNDPADLAETVIDNAPIMNLADDLRDKIKVFSLASGDSVHTSVVDVPFFEWVYEERDDTWRVEWDDGMFNNAIIRARLFDLADDGTTYVPTKHYGSTTTERIIVDVDLDWFPSLSQFEVDGTFTFDGFDSEEDKIYVNGGADIEIWNSFDGEISVHNMTFDHGDLWDLRYPTAGRLYMDLMGFAEIHADIQDEDRVELRFEFFGINTIRFGVHLDRLFPDELAFEF
jgi:hypothetical protein